MLYETKFLLALFVTLLAEVPILFILIKYALKIENIEGKKILFAGSIASLLTLPYVWFVLPPYINSRYYIHIAEAFAFITEAAYYHVLFDIKINISLLLSLITNIASFAIGVLIFY
jgi:hypothetical protein